MPYADEHPASKKIPIDPTSLLADEELRGARIGNNLVCILTI